VKYSFSVCLNVLHWNFWFDSLKQALPVIHELTEYPTTIHSDQGWHYQHNRWVKTLKQNKIFQSISRKATCSYNDATSLAWSNKMYYGKELKSCEALQKKITKSIDYYNNNRIRQKLAGCINKVLTLSGYYLHFLAHFLCVFYIGLYV